MLKPKDLKAALRAGLLSLKKRGVSNNEILSLVKRTIDNQKSIYFTEDQPPNIPVTGSPLIPIQEGVLFNPEQKIIRFQNKTIPLSSTESRLLFTFLKFHGEILTHPKLVQEVNKELAKGDCAVLVRVWLHRLRNKLEIIPQSKHWFKSIRGKGYYFSAE